MYTRLDTDGLSYFTDEEDDDHSDEEVKEDISNKKRGEKTSTDGTTKSSSSLAVDVPEEGKVTTEENDDNSNRNLLKALAELPSDFLRMSEIRKRKLSTISHKVEEEKVSPTVNEYLDLNAYIVVTPLQIRQRMVHVIDYLAQEECCEKLQIEANMEDLAKLLVRSKRKSYFKMVYTLSFDVLLVLLNNLVECFC